MANDQPERYANASNKHIEALILGLYRFTSEQAAHDKILQLQSQFTIARETLHTPENPSFSLWIKDFDMTDAERDKGYMGNYASVRIASIDGGLFTLVSNKLETELRYHPRRKRKTADMPNWGHPILRKIKDGRTFPSLADAQAELDQLHLEYPKTSVPGNHALYAMIFSRQNNIKQPVQRYVLEIQNRQGGGFTIAYRINETDQKPKKPSSKSVTKLKPEVASMGHFASMVSLKRKK